MPLMWRTGRHVFIRLWKSLARFITHVMGSVEPGLTKV